MDDAFGHWLAGLVDGEGSFIIFRNVDRRRRGDPYVRFGCRFQLRLRQDDVAALQQIQAETGLGIVRFAPRAGRDISGKRQATYWWGTVTKDDCLALVELLDRYALRSKKARDYAIWREAVVEWAKPRASGGPRSAYDWTRLGELRAELLHVRRSGRALQAV